jgi:hypothetical protein
LAENFGELTVSGLHNLVYERVILVKVWRDQLKLLLTLEESLDLVAQLAERFSRLRVRDFSPQLFLKCRVWKTILTDLADVASLVARITFERL